MHTNRRKLPSASSLNNFVHSCCLIGMWPTMRILPQVYVLTILLCRNCLSPLTICTCQGIQEDQGKEFLGASAGPKRCRGMHNAGAQKSALHISCFIAAFRHCIKKIQSTQTTIAACHRHGFFARSRFWRTFVQTDFLVICSPLGDTIWMLPYFFPTSW